MAKRKWRYIVADPKICHGRLTFRGTRVFVSDVLEDVAEGAEWDEICELWHNSITHDAIAEAVEMARDALVRSERMSHPQPR